MEDKLIKCEHCGSDMCYAIRINEKAYAYNCTGCGFTASDLLKEGEYDVETLYPISPFNSFFTYNLDPVPSFCQTTFHQLYSLLLPVTKAGIETL